jgi:hypothetical protein
MGLYAKVKGNREGPCAICGKHAILTYDHVPPKSCFNENAVLVNKYLRKEGGTISQNGTKFRTICGYCNNTLLGTEYDPSLIDLANKLFHCMLLREKGECPGKISIQVDVLRVAKSIAGHTLACDFPEKLLSNYAALPFFHDLMEFVLDPLTRDMGGYEIRYWFYPREPMTLLRGYALTKLGKSGIIMGHIMKFFPVAFWLIHDRPPEIGLRLPQLKISDTGPGTMVFDLDRLLPENFPENPAPDFIALFNDDHSHTARRR